MACMDWTKIKDDPQLLALIARAMEQVAKMSPEEVTTMLASQAQSWARAEASWPKSKFKWVDGVKVYDSYEDYCND